MSAPDSPSLWQLASGSLSFLLGFGSAVFAEPLRQRIFRPKLALFFSGGEDCVTRTPMSGSGYATYVRIKVTCARRRTAKSCSAYLVGIETLSPGGTFQPTNFVDSLPLSWSCQATGQEREPLDLLWGVNQYIDVVAAHDGSAYLEPQFSPIPLRYVALFRKTTETFRFTVLVSGDTIEPARLRFVVAWKGDAQFMDVYEDGPNKSLERSRER